MDTRTVDVNVDKFNARYDDLADSRNMPSNRRKNQPTGKKEKFNNRNNRQRPAVLAAAARPRPSACSASSWKRPATRS